MKRIAKKTNIIRVKSAAKSGSSNGVPTFSSSSATTVRTMAISAPGAPFLSTTPLACYIYGIIDIGKKIVLKARAVGSSPDLRVYSIPYKDIAALVSRSNYEEYDPTDDNLLVHNEALREAHNDHNCTVLPFRFSTIAKSESDVSKILANGYFKFKKKIDSLKCKVEMAVKVYCDIQAFRASIREEKRESTSKSLVEGDERVEDENKVASIDSELGRRTLALATILVKELDKISKQHVLSDLVFDDMILNGAFLIDEGTSKPFIEKLKEFDSRHGRNLIKIEWSGPYVPYSFTDPPEA